MLSSSYRIGKKQANCSEMFCSEAQPRPLARTASLFIVVLMQTGVTIPHEAKHFPENKVSSTLRIGLAHGVNHDDVCWVHLIEVLVRRRQVYIIKLDALNNSAQKCISCAR